MNDTILQTLEVFLKECLCLYFEDLGVKRPDKFIIVGIRDGFVHLSWVGAPRLGRDETVELFQTLAEKIDDGDWTIP